MRRALFYVRKFTSIILLFVVASIIGVFFRDKEASKTNLISFGDLIGNEANADVVGSGGSGDDGPFDGSTASGGGATGVGSAGSDASGDGDGSSGDGSGS